VVSFKAAPVPINLSVELKDGQTPKGDVVEIKGKKYDFPSGYLAPDPAIDAMLKPFSDRLSKDMDTVIANAAGEFPHTVNGLTAYVRRDDCALANPLVDAMREATSEKVGKKVDVFLQNGGGIRAPLPAGAVTKKTIYTILPFDNTIMTSEITGAQLLRFSRRRPSPRQSQTTARSSLVRGSLPQVSGLTYTMDLSAKTVSDVKVGGFPSIPPRPT
jgi:2',3'-cyclic-nucleotide 2'-phosphodiesterase (5'-nucleotidase family)